MDHSPMWVSCSSCVRLELCTGSYVHPTTPTTSISVSFQCPGPVKVSCPFCEKPMRETFGQLSRISLVERQRFAFIPSSAPHSHTFPIPYWHIESTISRSSLSRAVRKTWYGFFSVGRLAFRRPPPPATES